LPIELDCKEIEIGRITKIGKEEEIPNQMFFGPGATLLR
jgi:hypothetical protein